MDALNEALRGWQNFYFMMGGAAATLAGLMFVALSLGTHLINDKTRDELKIFATPSLIYFISTLMLAGVMLVPIFTPESLALVLFLGGIVGFVRYLPIARHLFGAARRNGDFTLADWLAQIIGPTASHILILLAALCFVISQWMIAQVAIGIATIVFLLCAITNTWGLVIWIVEQRAP